MLRTLKGELIKKGEEPVRAIMKAIACSESTARNKLNSKSYFSVPEAVKIQQMFFYNDNFEIEWLFYDTLEPETKQPA